MENERTYGSRPARLLFLPMQLWRRFDITSFREEARSEVFGGTRPRSCRQSVDRGLDWQRGGATQ
jgi:hypothetical protein